MATRKDAGGSTAIHWVHSHVDDEVRRVSNKGKMQCACRGEGATECDPSHEHHMGNGRADELAKKGAAKVRGMELADAAMGEMWFTLGHISGEFAQGSYKDWLR